MNKLWIEKQKKKGKTFDINRVLFGDNPDIINRNDEEKTDTPDNKPKSKDGNDFLLDRDLEVGVLKKEADLKHRQLQNLQIEGKLLPVDVVKDFYLLTIETLRTVFLQEKKSYANLFIQKNNLSQKQFVEIQKDIEALTISVMTQYKEDLINGIDSMVDEYKMVNNDK